MYEHGQINRKIDEIIIETESINETYYLIATKMKKKIHNSYIIIISTKSNRMKGIAEPVLIQNHKNKSVII